MFHISLLCIHRFSAITHISLFQQRRARFVCRLPVHCGYIWVPQHTVIFYTEVSSDWSKLVSHPTPLGWSCTPSVSRTWSPGSSVWPQQRSESSVWTGAETPAAVSHICWKTSVLLHPPPRVPSLLYSSMFFFYLSSVRSQTNNQIDKYDNISAVLSLKANLQFFGKRLSGCSRVISHQGGSNLGELTATNNQSFITELNATVLWPRGGRTRAALTEGGCFSPQCTEGLEPTSSVAVRRHVALWGKYKQMKRFKRLEI